MVESPGMLPDRVGAGGVNATGTWATRQEPSRPKFLLLLPQRPYYGFFGLRAAVLRFSAIPRALGCAGNEESRVALSCSVAGESGW